MAEDKKGKRKVNPIGIVIIILLLVIIALGSYYVFIKNSPAKAVSAAPASVAEASFSTDEFLVNLADQDAERYLKTTITLTYDSSNKELAQELTDNKSAVRDAIISVIRGKTASELRTTSDTDKLKSEIIQKVNSVLVNGKIIKVYYNDILIQ